MSWQLLVCSGSIATNGMVLCTVWDYEAPNYQFTITFNTRTNVEFTTEPQMGYSTC